MVGGGGPNGEEGRKRIDGAVGGLVWVQRRNGSWWPGQILDSEELLSETLVSSRSGTPIKLLGRDDSIVDWYDLEKAKGVKAFRCGDYDACIEKAKISAAKSSKRTRKYPQRENAIIIALEIEKTTSLSRDGRDPDGEPKDSASISHPCKDGGKTSSDETSSACEENSHSAQELSHSGISYEEINGSTYLKQHLLRGRRKTPNDSEDDGDEGKKRMKGLDDLGVAAERKIQVLALTNGKSMTNMTNGGSMPPPSKRKRSQVVHVQELLKRKYRRRPLTKVLENTTMVPVRIICDEFATPFERSDAISPSSEYGNSKNVKPAHLLNGKLPGGDSSDVLIDVPFVDEEIHPSGSSPIRQPSTPLTPLLNACRANSGRNFPAHALSLGQEGLNEPGPTSSSAACEMDKSASKWQSKGKRKARHINKTEESSPRKKPDTGLEKSDAHIVNHKNSKSNSNSTGLLNGFTDRKTLSSLGSSQRSLLFPYHQPRFLSHSGVYGDTPSLYEIEITVEATRPHQMQHVPYISLMSKLNGKPITGHPVTVQALEDGSCDPHISDYQPSGSCELDDEILEVGPVVKELKARRSKKAKRRTLLSRRRSSSSKSKSKSKSRRHGPSSKKTRKLSSLTGPNKLNMEKRKPMVQNTEGGPMLACVPLKVVFSRINEALNGSSSRSNHHNALIPNGT